MNGIDETARAAQAHYVYDQNELRARLMRGMVDDQPMPVDVPKIYDDWISDDRLAYFAVFAVFQYELKRYGLLIKGKGPFFCRGCEVPQPGWAALDCWECAWPKKIRAAAIECGQRWRDTRVAVAS